MVVAALGEAECDTLVKIPMAGRADSLNAAVAANVLSDGSVAYANAEQTAPITQSN